MSSTVVTFPTGQVSGRSEIVGTVPAGDRHGLVVAETPFHPLDHTWPDQPADRGLIGGLPVADCVTAARSPSGEIFLAADIPVRRGEDGWQWLVVHATDTALPVGAQVELEVDAGYRAALSAGHTACHLAALALNAAVADMWRKSAPRLDALGNPDFDQSAITSSRISSYASLDEYRLGKSLRKKGFAADVLEPSAVAAAVNERLKEWVAADVPVWIDVPGPGLTARRTWHCALPEGEASIPCGGTHVRRTSELGSVTVALELGEQALTMRTFVSTS
ncbi:metal-dependent hydrolase [Nonomuraea endophytica]|uniref:Alanyl-tRNA synthetase n=1 Tax=Nonomuraea endophytica TaxID=714136 RepID=A0A7W8ELW3_9ACTN|nr:metal-dependent hydrolase [Nonomuraea endophytica]MBB5083813.1 alanyl-tRNA synthetase [Nonomuraea endophytica]